MIFNKKGRLLSTALICTQWPWWCVQELAFSVLEARKLGWRESKAHTVGGPLMETKRVRETGSDVDRRNKRDKKSGRIWMTEMWILRSWKSVDSSTGPFYCDCQQTSASSCNKLEQKKKKKKMRENQSKASGQLVAVQGLQLPHSVWTLVSLSF